MGALSSKPTERTGANVVRTKLERANAASRGGSAGAASTVGNRRGEDGGARAAPVLQLASQKLKKLPDLNDPVKAALHTLDVSHNALGPDLPLRFADLKKLKNLKVEACGLERPPQLAGCEALKSFDCADNKLSAAGLEGALASLPRLEALVLRDNPLGALPRAVFAAGLCKLRTLDARQCNISRLAVLAGDAAPALVELLLDGNALRDVPAELAAACPHLARLSLESNRIETLPLELLKLRTLERIDLKGNVITKRALLALPGADDFLERRAATRKKDSGSLADLSVCGLED